LEIYFRFPVRLQIMALSLCTSLRRPAMRCSSDLAEHHNLHRAAVGLRDLAYAVEHAAQALSKATLEAIARS
jgi:hypothetical protein